MNQAIFLSYASQDADAASHICEALRAAGLEVWFDKNELTGGDAWDQKIRKQIKECALFVPVISANTNAREEGYFRLEWKLAVDRSHLMADDKAFFLPVLIDNVPEAEARVPDKFRERQWSRIADQASADAFAKRVSQIANGGTRAPPKQAPQQSNDGEPTQATITRTGRPASPQRSRLVATVALVAMIAVVAGVWFVIDQNRKATFVAESLNKIESLTRSEKYVEVFALAREVERAGGGGALTDQIKNGYSRPVDVQSTPTGAAISIKPFGDTSKDAAWIDLGTAPLQKIRVPKGALEWRATLPGLQSESVTRFAFASTQISFVLWPAGAAEATMVPVGGGEMRWGSIPGIDIAQKVKLAPYQIDREELTNREYAKFVQAGGYTREEFWKEPFRDGAKTLTLKEAAAKFKDSTGRTGPATWKLGNYPDGDADLPVRGISWYEAAAYASFAGKELPTIYHWYFADTSGDRNAMPGVLLPAANFERNAPRSAASTRTVSAHGAVNMAGNVREWISNRTDRDQRLAVGGAYTDIAHQYSEPSPRSAFDRAPDIGMRCMKRQAKPASQASVAASSDPGSTDLAYAVLNEKPRLDPAKIKPASDADYALFTRFFEPRPTALDVKVESIDDAAPHWIRNKVSFVTEYNNERMNAFLYFPRNAKPPYQTIIYMPGSNSFGNFRAYDKEAEVAGWIFVDQLLRGGRAVLFPVWKGSFERSGKFDFSVSANRERYVQQVGDLRQSMAFLATRPEIDQSRIGYYGVSYGAVRGAMFMALEPRLKVGILQVGGLSLVRENGDPLPSDLHNATFAPRVKGAVLMLNGRDDAIFPYESSQVPLFNLLGSLPNKKKHKTYPGGHFVYGWNDNVARDTHDWLDEHFGPVSPVSQK